ncbi:hypothetical protein OKA05_18780 [Luteolibacter arcticus]|uniref:Piwi domain-containing protein n=1 Tax=Luteolibacter arcticus TaxID=1581411 RepID=A0ABT3GM97_9BACT|nr:hypothetical protein [Luteolibacter arcticus]MCW1924617.1 hypothetical protein [Luteolibacter arcticus]
MSWNVRIFNEPILSFGGENQSYDIREGIQDFGPVDAGSSRAKLSVRIGIVGTPKTISAFKQWMKTCEEGIAGHDPQNPNLHPAFPGLDPAVGFRCSFTIDPTWESFVTEADIISAATKSGSVLALASLFHKHISALFDVSSAKPDVVICLPNDVVRKTVKPRFDDEGNEDLAPDDSDKGVDFHDYLKGLCLQSRTVFQLIWPRTYSEGAKGVQDPATRAWNLFGALFYKAGGIPWKLMKTPGGHRTCYVGISFSIRPEGGTFHSCLTQVFNDRGEGTILRGGLALKSEEDHEYHLSADSSEQLLSNALCSYASANSETFPDRVVIHKSSGYDEGELRGFNAAAEKHAVRFRDFLALRDSRLRLFRTGAYPPLRGTHLIMDDQNSILYTRGSVPFYRKYPGPYVPRSLHIRYFQSDSAQSELAEEILALTKLNWNKTQFDSFYPITLGGSKRIGEIYQWCPDAPADPISYSFFM